MLVVFNAFSYMLGSVFHPFLHPLTTVDGCCLLIPSSLRNIHVSFLFHEKGYSL